MRKAWTIAIDGPAGAGKSTVARMLAKRLGYLYIDSGAMYRAAALNALRAGVDLMEQDEVAALTRSARITFRAPEEEDGEQRVLLNGEDVTTAIRTPEVASSASVVSAIPGVRAALVTQQAALGSSGGVVMEGRDIGTVVFPNAELKIFLTASPEERAARRHADLLARGTTASLDEVRADQDERDFRDSTRTVSPLAAAPDAVVVDSDGLIPGEVAQHLYELVETRRREA